MRILITGVTGFVGASLLEHLAAGGHELYGLARSTPTEPRPGSVTFLVGDVTKPESLQVIPGKLDLLIHCAALLGRWGRSWDDYYNTNVIGTRNIAELCREKGIKNLLHVSSGGAHSKVTKYEQSKYLAERILDSYVDSVRVVTVRPEFLYGPRDMHVKKLFDAINRNRFVLINHGNSIIRPTFISDFSQHVVYLVGTLPEIPSGTTYTLAGSQMTWKDFARIVCKHYGVQSRFPEVPVTIMRFCARANELLSHLIGFPMLLNRDQVYFFSTDHPIDEENTTLLACATPLEEGLRYL
ncbi:MAG TPA: NAD-dependent epimerase/dehydratase family protein [Syntrophobacteria bacterium]|nr:NAD-dependent epimerase/dehydratase family protein [Syntrophobacteria bacterium]